MNIGIIGTDTVGSAVLTFLQQNSNHNITIYDKRLSKDMQEGYKEVVQASDLIYICLPSDLNVVKGALMLMNTFTGQKKMMVMIRSILPVGSTKELQSMFPNLILVANPNIENFKTAKQHVVGIKKETLKFFKPYLDHYHKSLWPDSDVLFVEPEEAERMAEGINK